MMISSFESVVEHLQRHAVARSCINATCIPIAFMQQVLVLLTKHESSLFISLFSISFILWLFRGSLNIFSYLTVFITWPYWIFFKSTTDTNELAFIGRFLVVVAFRVAFLLNVFSRHFLTWNWYSSLLWTYTYFFFLRKKKWNDKCTWRDSCCNTSSNKCCVCVTISHRATAGHAALACPSCSVQHSIFLSLFLSLFNFWR